MGSQESGIQVASTHYNNVFDVTQAGFDQWSSVPLVVIVVGLFVGIIFYLQCSGRLSSYKLYLLLPTVVISLMVLRPIDSFLKYRSLCLALRESRCEVVEGVVTQLHPLYSIKRGGIGEAFSVNGIEFTYRNGSAQVGFHQVGIIRNGLEVRIHYLGKNNPQIARLETAL